MKRTELNRRDFTKLTAAAFGGIVAGTVIGCGGDDDAAPPAGGAAGGGTTDGAGTTPADGDTDVALMLEEPHVCRGLNACEGKAKGGENDCAGLSTCATAAESGCHGDNDCKGQGGCEETAGRNSCKDQGNCNVPLGDDAWKSARAALEAAFEKKTGKTLNDAPPKG